MAAAQELATPRQVELREVRRREETRRLPLGDHQQRGRDALPADRQQVRPGDEALGEPPAHLALHPAAGEGRDARHGRARRRREAASDAAADRHREGRGRIPALHRGEGVDERERRPRQPAQAAREGVGRLPGPLTNEHAGRPPEDELQHARSERGRRVFQEQSHAADGGSAP